MDKTFKNDFQKNRNILKKDKVYDFLSSKYKKSDILCGNFGYIIKDKNYNNPIKKYYTDNMFYYTELRNYNLFKNNNILLPKIISKGQEKILRKDFNYIILENIRKGKKNISGYKDYSHKNLGKILSKIHKISFNSGKAYVHGNIHFSNLFLDNNKIGVFDLLSVHYGVIEYDLGSIYFYSGYDDLLLEKILKYYDFSSYIDYKKIYYYTICKIINNIQNNNYSDTSYLKKDLLKLKNKLKLFQ